jgi:hypothetical protein
MCYTFIRQCNFSFTFPGSKAFTQKGLKITCPVLAFLPKCLKETISIVKFKVKCMVFHVLAFLPKCLKETISIVKFKVKCMVFHALVNDFPYTVSFFNKNFSLISDNYRYCCLHAFC